MLPIEIDQRRRTWTLFVITWAGGAILTGLTFWLILSGIQGRPSPSDWVKLVFAGVTLFGLLGFASYRLGFCRLASATLTEETLIARALFSDCTAAWDDVGAVTIHEPVEKKMPWTMEVVTVDGQSRSLIVPPEKGQEVRDVFQDILLREDWEGAPQPGVINLGYIVLGLVVAVFGVWWSFEVWREWQAGQLMQVQNQGDLKKVVVKIALVVLAPLGGVAGVCYGLYHHIKRPIVVEPGFHHRIGPPVS